MKGCYKVADRGKGTNRSGDGSLLLTKSLLLTLQVEQTASSSQSLEILW